MCQRPIVTEVGFHWAAMMLIQAQSRRLLGREGHDGVVSVRYLVLAYALSGFAITSTPKYKILEPC